MDIEELHPDLRKPFRRVPSVPFHRRSLIPALQRIIALASRTPVAEGVSTTDLSVGAIKLRIFRPNDAASGAAMLWIHGGGMIVGTHTADNRTCSSYASELGLVVVSVDYRLAPQHRFPAAIDDCYAAWNWLVNHAADYGVDPFRLVVAGESAGAGLGAALVHRIRDEHRTQPAAQLLHAPMLDDRTAADPSLDQGFFGWRWSDNRAGGSSYLGHEPGQPSEPRYAVAARREELNGLPTTWIGCGDKDLFFAESATYAERLQSAGVEVEFYEVAGVPHGLHTIAPGSQITKAWWDRSYEFLSRVLDVERRNGD